MSDRTHIAFRCDAELAERARAAFLETQDEEGHESFSAFIAAAITREVERVEDKHNDGQPWEAAEAGEMPRGRPRKRSAQVA